MSTLTLAEFLLARIGEDEEGAITARDGDDWHDLCTTCEATRAARAKYGDPARVLAECEAKRRIAELHHEYRGLCPADVDPRNPPEYREPWPCETLRILALPYADHPDYRQEWRP